MNKAYSNKALPSGTVLREWRLEEVLGVGGFGIVYKGRGIYFDELVAIKEYFPSAISDRKDGDTVVPINSDAEEVHALGLKKFVEEAKLLWNLSTPSRHPNIVSVRSLFEIHGTAYMVMDFEDGISLSRLLKKGRRFNEASLLALLRPIAEGLERAHRVGVLHRDIKPPNILVSDDNRPVLIDFGSARFELAEATSTKVTFHTPPYAAIEQYVKTYPQGPWTDIYALGVVLYECITGEKPPEVLERMHGGLGKPLAEQDFPGFSKTFLKAVDAAMTIKPDERPQSISQWLDQFSAEPPAEPTQTADEDDDDGEATRIGTYEPPAQAIQPVAPPPPGFSRVEAIETPVPSDPSEAEFKRAGEDTSASRKHTEVPPPPTSKAKETTPGKKVAPAKPAGGDASAKKASSKRPLVLSAVAAVAIAGAAGGWYALKAPAQGPAGDGFDPSTVPAETAGASTVQPGDPAQALQALATDARAAHVPEPVAAAIDTAQAKLAGTQPDDAAKIVAAAATQFAADLQGDVDRRAQRIARTMAWADPRRPSAAQDQSAPMQKIAASLRQARNALGLAQQTAAGAATPDAALVAARQALAQWQAFVAAQGRASGAAASAQPGADDAHAQSATLDNAVPEAMAASSKSDKDSGSGASPAKVQKLAGIVSTSHEIAARVIQMGNNAPKPRPNATDKQKENYRVLQQNVTAAKDYLGYLDGLNKSMAKAKSDREADTLIGLADQTRRYLTVLLSRSSAATQ